LQTGLGTNEILSSPESYDEQKVLSLWEQSAELVNLSPEENIFLKQAASKAQTIG